MNVLVVGCGKMGSDLAYRLFRNGHVVTIVDKDLTAFNRLPPDFRGRMVEGDALNEDILIRAGIQNADALTSLTDYDSVNMVVGHIARHNFHITNVVVRNNYPNSLSFFETFNLQVISASLWAAQRVEEMIHHNEIRSVFSAGNGEVEVYEILVPEGWSECTMEELFLNQDCQLVAVTKGGKAYMPSPNQKLEVGDIIHVSTTYDGINAIRERLSHSRLEGVS